MGDIRHVRVRRTIWAFWQWARLLYPWCWPAGRWLAAARQMRGVDWLGLVSISQVIGCEDRLWNDLYCVEWGVKLYSNQPSTVVSIRYWRSTAGRRDKTERTVTYSDVVREWPSHDYRKYEKIKLCTCGFWDTRDDRLGQLSLASLRGRLIEYLLRLG